MFQLYQHEFWINEALTRRPTRGAARGAVVALLVAIVVIGMLARNRCSRSARPARFRSRDAMMDYARDHCRPDGCRTCWRWPVSAGKNGRRSNALDQSLVAVFRSGGLSRWYQPMHGALRTSSCIFLVPVDAVLVDIVKGTWQVAMYVVWHPKLRRPGVTEIPLGDHTRARGRRGWPFASTVSPGEVLVDIDWDERVMLAQPRDRRQRPGRRPRASPARLRALAEAGASLMHELVLYLAVIWTGALLLAGVVRVIRAEAPLSRLLALDMLSLILIALLLLQSALIEDSHLLDAAVALALLSFAATVGAARYFARGRPF